MRAIDANNFDFHKVGEWIPYLYYYFLIFITYEQTGKQLLRHVFVDRNFHLMQYISSMKGFDANYTFVIILSHHTILYNYSYE